MEQKKKPVKDTLSIIGVVFFALWFMLAFTAFAILVGDLIGIEQLSIMTATTFGTAAATLIIYQRFKKRGHLGSDFFSLSALKDVLSPLLLSSGGYVLHFILNFLFGGAVTTPYRVSEFISQLLFIPLYALLLALCNDGFGVDYLRRRGYDVRGMIAVMLTAELFFQLIGYLLEPWYGFPSVKALMVLTVYGLKSVLCVLLFVRYGSTVGRILLTMLSLGLDAVPETYTPVFFATDMLLCAALAVSVFLLIKGGTKEKTA